jgi:hypothetical protein
MVRMRRQDLQCLIITGDDGITAVQVGETYPLIRKPVDCDALMATIRHLLDRAAPRRAPA